MFTMKVIFVLALALTVVSAQTYGGISQLSGDDLKEAEGVLSNSLTILAAGDGPSYKLGRVISATKQIVSGNSYVYQVELVEGTNTKVCTVDIWSQPWLKNGIQVTFDCPEGKVVKNHD
ncbi:sarcocystatin-A-like [Drosophila innubila]|uniref:sarcocystatin-A-like n=1 Tax=Drosophila innubila TaxID=198719 RepID=UPI00148B3A90|nr:sarcocystatin-A-like [Drosophila innubila]